MGPCYSTVSVSGWTNRREVLHLLEKSFPHRVNCVAIHYDLAALDKRGVVSRVSCVATSNDLENVPVVPFRFLGTLGFSSRRLLQCRGIRFCFIQTFLHSILNQAGFVFNCSTSFARFAFCCRLCSFSNFCSFSKSYGGLHNRFSHQAYIVQCWSVCRLIPWTLSLLISQVAGARLTKIPYVRK